MSFFRRSVARPSTGLVATAVEPSPCQYARMPLLPQGVVSSLGNAIVLPVISTLSVMGSRESSPSDS